MATSRPEPLCKPGRIAGVRICGCIAAGIITLLLALGMPARAADSTYADQLVQRARGAGLANAPIWHALLHYEPRPFGGVKSLADSPDFFLAADGVTNPDAELDATIRAFFLPADAVVRSWEHPQCTFVARYRWLREQLQFDAEQLPQQPCTAFEEWRAAIDPVSLTLVFPEAYMNNPSSMFGHTLLRFDTEQGGERRDLLAYAANYAADPGNDNAVVFAWKGIFGGYGGMYSLQPYYEKINEYSDWEQRDLWEYELALSQAEIDRLLQHLWEMRGVVFAYFFFDENCAYQVMALLRAARPDLPSWLRFKLWVIPADTVRVIVHDAGLLRGVGYRPSATTKLRQAADDLPSEARRLAVSLAKGEVGLDDPRLEAMPPRQRALTLTVAHDYLRYSYLSRSVDRQPGAERARQLLIALSRLPDTENLAPPVPRPAVRPDQGHRTARLAVGAGWRDQRAFAQMRLRPSFHDLLDPMGGYIRGAQIEFLDAAVRVYGDGEVRLHEFTLIDILSLAARDDLFQPISWSFRTQAKSILLKGTGHDSGIDHLGEDYVWHTQGGVGLAYDLPAAGLAYGFLQAGLDVGPALTDSFSVGPGAEVGTYFDFFEDRWRSQLFAEVLELALGEQHTSSRFGMAQRLTLGAQTALRFELTQNRDFGENWIEGMLSGQWYF